MASESIIDYKNFPRYRKQNKEKEMAKNFSILILTFFAASVLSQRSQPQDDYPVDEPSMDPEEEPVEPMERGTNTHPVSPRN